MYHQAPGQAVERQDAAVQSARSTEADGETGGQAVRGRSRWAARAVYLLPLWILGVGCQFGPKALEMTHGRYDEAVRRVREEELLRNLVHLRYNESPGTLNVANIAAQYEIDMTAEARPFFVAPNPSNSNVIFKTFTSILPDLSMTGSNRPTLSLDPADDAEGTRQFLTPINADTLIFLAQSSWPVSTVVRLYLERANGVPNAVTASGPKPGIAPDFARFRRAAELMQTCQNREMLTLHVEDQPVSIGQPLSAAEVVEAVKSGLEVRRAENGEDWELVRRERHLVIQITPGSENSPEIVELTQIFNLVPGLNRYELTFGARGLTDPMLHPTPPSSELRVVPRSNAQVYFYLANGVEVPPEHVNEGVVRLAADEIGNAVDTTEITRDLFEVHACKGRNPPPGAYLAVRYRGYWYYIDDSDATTKATFALMLHLSRLDFARQKIGVGSKPLLTLPVGR